MKHCFTFLWVMIACTILYSVQIPQSSLPVITDANRFGDLVRVDPDDSIPERLKTNFWLWQDGNFLVVYAEAEIDSTFDRGYQSRRDEGSGADMLRIQLVTMPQAYMAYAYLAYPLGNLCDGIRTQDMDIDYSWDSEYSYSSEFRDNLWCVTMRIPLGSLRFRQEQPYNWRVIFTRYTYDDRSSFSSPYANTSQRNAYFMMSHPISLSHPISKDFPLRLKPYFVKSYDLIEHTDSFDPHNLGLDLAYIPSQRLRLKLTFNPDFSDIPMDSAADNYNSKYPPYYYENRFFFTEDLQVFNLDDYFYTRNIVQPQFAYKLTGNSGRVNWGILGALDKEITDNGELINPDDYYQAISINPSWERLSINNALVSRINSGFFNHGYVGSLNYRILSFVTASAELLAAVQKADDEDELHRGYEADLEVDFDFGDLTANLSYDRVSKDLQHAAGFIYSTDYDSWSGYISWDKVAPMAVISSVGANSNFSLGRSSLDLNRYDLGNIYFYSYLQLKRKLMLTASYSTSTDLDNFDDIHRSWTSHVGFNYNPVRQFNFGARMNIGESLIYSLSEVHSRNSLFFTASLNLARKLSLSYYTSINFLGYPRVNTVDLGGGNSITLILDDKYAVHNMSMVYTYSQNLSLSGGMGLSTYESNGRYADLSYYSNLSYEFKPGYFLYFGLKARQSQMEEQSFSNPLPQYRRDLASAYLKLSFTL